MGEYIDRVEYCEKHCRCSNEYCDRQSCPIWEAPAADVATVVHGRKIEDGDIGCFWLCSLCGECLPYGANYCPNCGAKMDGGDGDAVD